MQLLKGKHLGNGLQLVHPVQVGFYQLLLLQALLHTHTSLTSHSRLAVHPTPLEECSKHYSCTCTL
jgi:hypothetical protein